MALLKEVWLQDIQPNFYQGIEFITNSIDHSSLVTNNTIHIPQSGVDPEIVVNPSVFPLTINQRIDDELTYKVDCYVVKPTLVTNVESYQLSYDKRMSIMGANYAYLRQRVGRQTAFNWSVESSARIVRTSGANGTTLAPSATGTRKKLTLVDLLKASLVLDRDLVPYDERYLLLDSGMYRELLEDPNLVRKDFVDKAVLPTGVIDKLLNFNIMLYSFPVIYDNATPPVRKALNQNTGLPTTPATTDNIGCIAWSKYAVSKALSGIDIFLKEKQPEYAGGDTLNCLAWHGSSLMRKDQKGVVSIVQSA